MKDCGRYIWIRVRIRIRKLCKDVDKSHKINIYTDNSLIRLVI
jgi:hypothetical protein